MSIILYVKIVWYKKKMDVGLVQLLLYRWLSAEKAISFILFRLTRVKIYPLWNKMVASNENACFPSIYSICFFFFRKNSYYNESIYWHFFVLCSNNNDWRIGMCTSIVTPHFLVDDRNCGKFNDWGHTIRMEKEVYDAM